jgi:DNA-binding SARP family transcriptional activator
MTEAIAAAAPAAHNGPREDAVALEIRLLGIPSITIGGDAVRPRGNKVWGLLAYLLMCKVPATRSHLSDLLFAQADDPIRALRWNLTELRHVLGSDSISTGDLVAVTLPPGANVDISLLTSSTWSPASNVEDLGRDLLEGISFSECPAFEAWLTNQRRHLSACAADVMREATAAGLAAGETDAAIDTAVRLVAMDPLDEGSQALLIQSYAIAGDAAAATRQLEACRKLLQSELGVEPSDQVIAAVHASPATVVRTPATGRHSVRAQLDAGRAAVGAGALVAGLECLRRAAAESHSIGDLELALESMLALGSTLAHAGVDRHPEAASALHAAINVAARLDRPSAAGEAQMELAWMDFLRARYDRARTWIEAALTNAPTDSGVRCMALWLRGKCAMETGAYAASLEDLRAAAELVGELGNPMRQCYCLASLGRTLLMMEAFDEARPILEQSLAIGRSEGFAWFSPVPQTFLAELETAEGNLPAAHELLDDALATAQAVADNSLECQVLRAKGMLEASAGCNDAAIEMLKETRVRLMTNPDWEWVLAYTLDGLAAVAVSMDHPMATRWIDELEMIAGRANMHELLAHAYIYKARLGDGEAWDIATVLGAEVDNPALHRLLAERPSAAVKK